MQAHELMERWPQLFTLISGPGNAKFAAVRPPAEAQTGDLCFCSHVDQLSLAIAKKVHVIVVIDPLKAKAQELLKTHSGIALLSTGSIPLALSYLLPRFDKKKDRFKQSHPVHATAIVHPTAKIGSNCLIGPYAVVGENVQIGDGVTIGAHTVVEMSATIGQHTLLHPQVFIGAECIVGAFCEIHPHTTIGSDGYGYATKQDRTHNKIPQIGRVVIADEVEIGANCALDRGTLTDTTIGQGTKLDNFCHIAHNVKVGRNCLITAGIIIAGSSEIGDNFVCGGRVSVTDHVKITHNVHLAGLTAVANDIEKPGAYGGYPIQPLKEFLKTTASLVHVPKMRKELAQLRKKIGLE